MRNNNLEETSASEQFLIDKLRKHVTSLKKVDDQRLFLNPLVFESENIAEARLCEQQLSSSWLELQKLIPDISSPTGYIQVNQKEGYLVIKVCFDIRHHQILMMFVGVRSDDHRREEDRKWDDKFDDMYGMWFFNNNSSPEGFQKELVQLAKKLDIFGSVPLNVFWDFICDIFEAWKPLSFEKRSIRLSFTVTDDFMNASEEELPPPIVEKLLTDFRNHLSVAVTTLPDVEAQRLFVKHAQFECNTYLEKFEVARHETEKNLRNERLSKTLSVAAYPELQRLIPDISDFEWSVGRDDFLICKTRFHIRSEDMFTMFIGVSSQEDGMWFFNDCSQKGFQKELVRLAEKLGILGWVPLSVFWNFICDIFEEESSGRDGWENRTLRESFTVSNGLTLE